MSRRPTKPAPVVVKRPAEQRRKLPPELEAFARSGDEKLRIRRPRADRGLIRDPREGYAIAGVANRDARAVYDVRAHEMRALWNEGVADEEALGRLGQLFHDALRLELWRARRLTSFAAFAEEVVGIGAGRAEALAEAAAARSGQPATPLTERAIALWLRTEAGLYEGDENARARVRGGERRWTLELSVELDAASPALAGAGARHLPLARERAAVDARAGARERNETESARMAPGRERAAAEPVREGDRGSLGADADWAHEHDSDEPELAAQTRDLAPEPEARADSLEAEPAPGAPSSEARGESRADPRRPGRNGSEAEPPSGGGARLLTRKPRNDAPGQDVARDRSRSPNGAGAYRDRDPYRGRDDGGREGYAGRGERPRHDRGAGSGRDFGERFDRERREPGDRGERAGRRAHGEPADRPGRAERAEPRTERPERWRPKGERSGDRAEGSRFERPRFGREARDGGRRFEREHAQDARRFDPGGRRPGKVEARGGGRERNEVEARAGGRERYDVEKRAGARGRSDVDARAGGRERKRDSTSAGRFGPGAGRAKRFGDEPRSSGREPFTQKQHGKGKGFGARHPLPDRSEPGAAHGRKTKPRRDDDSDE